MQAPNEHLKQAIIEVVENQIEQNDPKETRKTFERLLNDGYSELESKEMIGAIVATHIFQILKSKEDFDEAKYVSQLKCLPKMPWD